MREAGSLNPSLPPQPQESPKGKRKADLNLEDRKPPSKPSAGPPALKRPKCKQTGFLLNSAESRACVSQRKGRGLRKEAGGPSFRVLWEGAGTSRCTAPGHQLSLCSLTPQCPFLVAPPLQPQPLPQPRRRSQRSPAGTARRPGELELAPRSWARSCRVWWWCSVASRIPSARSFGTKPWSWGPSTGQTGPRTAHTSCRPPTPLHPTTTPPPATLRCSTCPLGFSVPGPSLPP